MIKYLHLIGLILLVLILLKIDLEQVLLYLKNARYQYLLFGYPFLLLLVYLKSIRWNLLMRDQGVRLSLFRTFYVYLWGFYFGAVTPGRIGEASKAIYVHDRFDTLGRSFVSVFVDRAYDVAIRFALIFILYPLYSDLFEFKFIGFFILVLLVVIGIVILVKLKSIRNIIARFSKFILPSKYYPSVKNNISGFVSDTVRMITQKKLIMVSALLTVLSFLCYCIIAYAILMSFNIQMDFIYNIFCIVVSGLVVIVPISISGLGVREAVMIYLFGNIGLDKEAAVLFSLSIFAITAVLGIHGWILNIAMMIGGWKGKGEEKGDVSSNSNNSEE
jgi:uncharacterized protein (TIRG00374 family)